jgi:hypothetical protein
MTLEGVWAPTSTYAVARRAHTLIAAFCEKTLKQRLMQRV